MPNKKKALITTPDSPYQILEVPFNADTPTINKAQRVAFKKAIKNPNIGRDAPGIAQRELTDPKKRIKVDAFCCEVRLPLVELKEVSEKLHNQPSTSHCHHLENPLVLSDIFFPDDLCKLIEIEIDFGVIPYRRNYERK